MQIAGLPRLRSLRRATPLEAFSRTEKVVAFCRVLLVLTTLAVVVVDPKQPSFWPEAGYLVLLAYLLFSLVMLVLVRNEWVPQDRIGYVATACDVVFVSAVTLFTERGPSPFFLLHVFVISSVSVRWGMTGALPVTLILAFLYPLLVALAGRFVDADEFVFHRAHLVRPLYLLALGYLLGYLGEHERRSKRKLGFMLDLVAPVPRDTLPTLALARLLRHGLGEFEAQTAILTVRDPESGRWFAWTVSGPPAPVRVTLRIGEQQPWALPFAAETEGFLANDLRPGRTSALCYDVQAGTMSRRAIPADVPLPGGGVHALLMAPILIRRELRGRVVIARSGRRKFTRDDLEFLLVVAGQAAAAFEATRLQRKSEEVAVLEERARIARDLHDGFIQSLAGIDLRVEATKLLLERNPARVPKALEELHQAVDAGYREVRHYLTVLRAASRQAQDLGATLDRLAAEFAIRERLRVHLARPPQDPGLPASTAYELTQIVREALHNAVRHGGATQAIVKLAARPTHVYLVVGAHRRGVRTPARRHAADGFLQPTACPWSIRERTAALGGSLRVWSRSGHGAEVSLLIPIVAAAAARSTSSRREESA
jgi:signal transduction histidine kinase